MKELKDRVFLYGGDYNPDQWLEYPEILKKDIEMMKKAKINTVTLGVFAWSKLEPREGEYDFEWLEEIIQRLYKNGISTILSTPSGARPHWMAEKYPEILRVNSMRQRELFGMRHNHCFSSPVYRRKVREINIELAKRFDSNEAVILWHISNEYGGECHCPICQEAFRGWLKERYGTIEEVNRRWYTGFWSHHYDSFEQIESPSPIGEGAIHGLTLDWKRFVTYQTVDFCRAEIQALRDAGAKKPATTNMMYDFKQLNYHKFGEVLDITSWDNYPAWHKEEERIRAIDVAMQHDIIRSIKRKPYLLMESCPSATNWQPVAKLKRPGMLEAASLQAIAHGSESVLYFQIRKGRGGSEKFHGAVIDHYGGEDDRVYQECRQVGEVLEKIGECQGSEVRPQVAIVFDWENRWAMEEAQGAKNENMDYKKAAEKSYRAFRRLGLDVDMIDMEQSIDEYKIVAAPMLYMFRAGFEERVREFVKNGGVFILTYWSGVVDENDLCMLGGTPGNLMDVMGLRSTEIDALYDGEWNRLVPVKNVEEICDIDEIYKSDKINRGDRKSKVYGRDRAVDILDKEYRCENLCQLVSIKEASAFMVYGDDFYANTPAATVNRYGDGKAYYICADAQEEFYEDLYEKIVRDTDIVLPFDGKWKIPEGVEVTTRYGKDATYIFVQNFGRQAVKMDLNMEGRELLYGEQEGELGALKTWIIKEEK